MNSIKQIVKNKEWQELRRSLQGTWKTSSKQNLLRLNKYLGSWTDEKKLRRVHNYLGALRGLKNKDIISMRQKVKRRREFLGFIKKY